MISFRMENNRKFSILNGTSGSISKVEDDSISILENDSQVESIIDEILSGEHFLRVITYINVNYHYIMTTGKNDFASSKKVNLSRKLQTCSVLGSSLSGSLTEAKFVIVKRRKKTYRN